MSFEDAYKLLDQARADLPTPPLRELVMTEVANWQLGFNDELTATKTELTRGAGELSAIAKDLSALGVGHAEEIIEHVGANVKANPLLYAGGAALGALVIGFLMSRPTPVRQLPVEPIAEDDFADDVVGGNDNDVTAENDFLAEGILP